MLGIGPSHPVVIEGMHGLAYTSPARHTAEYVKVLKLAFHGTGHVSHQGEFFQCRGDARGARLQRDAGARLGARRR